jgi:predicted nucleic acid-binding protein
LEVILDTNALSAFFEGDAALGAVLHRAPRLFLPVVVLGEYRFGLLRSKKRRLIEAALDGLEAAATVLPIDLETVRPYAEIRDALKRAGTPIPSNDLWIAALALRHGLPIVSRDAHFERVHGVARISW